ncbi:MAG: hypothetical protein QXT77_00920, partial [Candidatus Methanomethylicaceae archaeon]
MPEAPSFAIGAMSSQNTWMTLEPVYLLHLPFPNPGLLFAGDLEQLLSFRLRTVREIALPHLP